MNKVNPFPVFTVPGQLIFISNVSITEKAGLVANLAKKSLAMGTPRSITACFT